MPGESEYHRCYTTPTHLSPEPDGIAGASSAHLAVTQEPPLGHKRKPLGHDRKVTFTTDYTEHGSPTKEDDKVLRFRAGFRRTHLPTPTEYNMQYSWKAPVGESPLLAAADMLQEDEQGSTEGAKPNDDPGHPSSQSTPPKPSRPLEDMERTSDHHHHHHRSKSKTSPPKKHKSHHKSPKKKTSSGHKQHKKHASSLVSEYRAQFKPWPVSAARVKPEADGAKDGARSGASTPRAGHPAILSDPSDPRLLRHSPLPAPKMRPHPLSFQRGSEYANNFHSPTEFKFVGGAWQHPRPEGPDDGDEDKHREEKHSWFDQVTELREKAVQYRHRAESSQLSCLRLLQLQRDQRDLLERASTSSSTLSSPTSHSSGSSSSSSSRSGSRSPPLIKPEGDVRLEDVEEESGDRSSQEDESREPALNQNANNNLSAGADLHPRMEHPPSPQPAPVPTELPTTYKGRVPTPILQEESDERPHYRHHLNRTTPSDGGLLVSPVKLPYLSSSPKYRKDMRSCAPILPSPRQESHPLKQHLSSSEQQQPRPNQDPKIRSSKLSPLRPATSGVSKPTSHGGRTLLTYSPPPRGHSHSVGSKSRSGAFRKLTFDSRDPAHAHHKRDLQASHGRRQAASSFQSCETCGSMLKSSTLAAGSINPSAARGLQSKGKDHLKPPSVRAPLAATVASSQPAHGSSLRSRPSQHSVPHTVGAHSRSSPKLADFRRPAALLGQPDRDVDELSLSSLSLSSCSVASEVLRRAQNRRDNFWMQPRMTAT